MTMIRFRETVGTSWRDKRRPGVRHWRSSSVSFGLVGGFCYLIGLGLYWLGFVPVVLMIWLSVEIGLLAASAILTVVLMAMYHKGPQDVRLIQWGWFYVIDVNTQ